MPQVKAQQQKIIEWKAQQQKIIEWAEAYYALYDKEMAEKYENKAIYDECKKTGIYPFDLYHDEITEMAHNATKHLLK